MRELKYVILGAPRTKKNHQVIAGAGRRCPCCGKLEKQWIRQSAAHDEFTRAAGWQIRPRPQRPIDYPVNICYRFYMDTNRVVDALNLMACLDDILVENGIIQDDNSRIVQGHDGTRVLLDRENPRTEICITQMPGAATGQMTFNDVF